MTDSWRLSLYRGFQRRFLRPGVFRRVVSAERYADSAELQLPKRFERRQPGVPRIWCHAASAGELELIWEVIREQALHRCELIITVFSESARTGLQRIVTELAGSSARVVHAGYSPWEGNWERSLEAADPDLFVTVKYEAWPDLWFSLAGREVPLMVVGARARSSFRIIKRLRALLGGRLPALFLALAEEGERGDLAALFPEAEIRVTGDPRWDRVEQRARRGNERAAELIREAAASGRCPRPWGVIGSAWREDLAALEACLPRFSGTLWVVPHEVKGRALESVVEALEGWGRPVRRTSAGEAEWASMVLVDEMGFLSELYSAADWAVVGGGFGKSVHSTIEPAIRTVPVLCGPRGVERFTETGQLERVRQLTVARDAAQVRSWWERYAERGASAEEREMWARHARERLGAAGRVSRWIDSLLQVKFN